MLILVLELKKMPIFTLVCGALKRNGIKIVFFMVTVGKGMYYHYVGRGYQPWGPMCTIQGCCFGNVHNNTLSMEIRHGLFYSSSSFAIGSLGSHCSQKNLGLLEYLMWPRSAQGLHNKIRLVPPHYSSSISSLHNFAMHSTLALIWKFFFDGASIC